jgi:hypothetical protein
MKGFIEVTDKKGRKHLVNIRHIEEIDGSVIYFAFQTMGSFEQDYINCEESYEQLKQLIERQENND